MTTKIVIGAGRFEKGSKEYERWKGPEDSLLPSKVLEFTIKKYDEDVEIINTYGLDRPQFKRRTRPTPFSMVRFWIPELCGFQGKTVYLDADMVVFAPIRELIQFATGDFRVWATPQDPSVCVIDCEKCRDWNVKQFIQQCDINGSAYQKLRVKHLKGGGLLPPEWNHRDEYYPGVTRLLHYTNLKTQPWKVPGRHPHEEVWLRELYEALEADAVPKSRWEEAEKFLSKFTGASAP